MPPQLARYWIGTIQESAGWTVPDSLTPPLVWLRGQEEIGAAGNRHWQLLATTSKQVRLASITRLFGFGHWEATRSRAAEEYVWKDDTAVAGTRFELGSKPIQRNSAADWELVRACAQRNSLNEIPADIYVRHYFSLRAIAADNAKAVGIVRTCHVFWGPTGTGKSRRAWLESGMETYAKDPRTKWWCGYRGETNVIIDEFRGSIDVSHLLRWTDRYPVTVETKGSSQPLMAQTIWITSNLSPMRWYPDIDVETLDALLRRLTIVPF